jgi:hypothetical protein
MKRVAWVLALLLTFYFLLTLPDKQSIIIQPAQANPFAWNMDSTWSSLEKEFTRVRKFDIAERDSLAAIFISEAEQQLAELQADSLILYDDIRLKQLLDHSFSMAPLFATLQHQEAYLRQYSAFRALIKHKSQHWNIQEPDQRIAVYTLLYGMRAAVEEVLLQADTINFNPILTVTDEPSVTPSAIIQGIRIHSGDLLVSRGGAEVSAFISRGNDYPGNFSHVALVYINATNNQPWFIEAHIEKGVAIATAEEYLNDKKLRFMVLRPRFNLPQLQANPMLPHDAAKTAYEESMRRHIPYDFKMNFYDSSSMFCSEVGSFAYRQHGLHLWQAESTISAPGTVQWLNTFGVENFVTQMPSDLEYDPQLSLVAEWCDPETLLKDHLDNAVMDALLERANAGMEIGYSRWLLPLARIVKAYSMLLNSLGKPGIIPEGMSATQALKNNSFVDLYQQTKKNTEEKINSFRKEKGYRPPYWVMVAFARQSV